MSPQRKDIIPNQDKKSLGIKKYQSKSPPGFKQLRNEADDDHPEYTYTSCTHRDDTPRNDRYDTSRND